MLCKRCERTGNREEVVRMFAGGVGETILMFFFVVSARDKKTSGPGRPVPPEIAQEFGIED